MYMYFAYKKDPYTVDWKTVHLVPKYLQQNVYCLDKNN